MPVNEQIVDSVSASNLKTLGDGPAFYTNLAYGDAVAHQRAMNTIREASVGTIVDKLVNADPAEAMAVLKMTTGDSVAAQMQALLAALNSGQQGVKSAQTVPPVTSPGV